VTTSTFVELFVKGYPKMDEHLVYAAKIDLIGVSIVALIFAFIKWCVIPYCRRRCHEWRVSNRLETAIRHVEYYQKPKEERPTCFYVGCYGQHVHNMEEAKKELQVAMGEAAKLDLDTTRAISVLSDVLSDVEMTPLVPRL
jgi:hypothetical protein